MILDACIDICKISLLLISLNISANELNQINKQDFSQDINSSSIIIGFESNTYKDVVYLNPSISYVNSGFNIGVSSQNIPVYNNGAQNYERDTYFNLSKIFNLTDKFSTSIITQTGYVLDSSLNKDTIHLFDYIDFKYKPIQKLSIHFGPYYVNKNLSLLNSHIGFQTGFRIILIQDIIKLNVNYISGHSNVSGAIGQLIYKSPINGLSPYIGIAVPETNSGNQFYGIIGVNYVLEKL